MIYTITIILLMFLSSFLLAKLLSRLAYFNFLFTRKERYGGIDGLRGYLALFVLVDHFIITWYWHHDREWGAPPEVYISNMGNVGVMIFFMITGFLFTSKIIRDKGNINWKKLYRSRVFRIYPLYLLSLVLISFIVFYQSGFALNVEPSTLLTQYVKWFLYQGTILNGFENTRIINAGVDWTLKYEWLFYLSLPLLAWAISKGKWMMIFFALGVSVLSFMQMNIVYFNTRFLIFFVVGAVLAYLYTYIDNEKTPMKYIQTPMVSFLVLVLLVVAMAYPQTYGIGQIIAASLFFALVVLGNTLFGLFESKASLLLGEVSYSIYLLHAIVIYVLVSVFDVLDIERISLVQYAQTMPLFALLSICVAVIAYITIELPGIKYGKK